MRRLGSRSQRRSYLGFDERSSVEPSLRLRGCDRVKTPSSVLPPGRDIVGRISSKALGWSSLIAALPAREKGAGRRALPSALRTRLYTRAGRPVLFAGPRFRGPGGRVVGSNVHRTMGARSRAPREPRWSFRSSRGSALRYAARTFRALSFQDSPRTTRFRRSKPLPPLQSRTPNDLRRPGTAEGRGLPAESPERRRAVTASALAYPR